MIKIPHQQKENVAGDIRYKRNYLTEVIIRVDLLNPLAEIDKQLSPKIASVVSKEFPISEPKKGIAKEYQISPSGIKETLNKEVQEWIFHGINRDKTLTLTASSFFIVYNIYKSFEILEQEFSTVFSKLLEVSSDIQARRLGLRYINNIKLDEDQPLNWDKYINTNLLQTLCFYNQPQSISRAFHNLEHNFGDYNLRYQFGLFNPDYPAAIKKKHFVMDFDAYYEGVQEYQEIVNHLNKFHTSIQNMFEMSIKDDFRKILNEQAR